MSKPQTQKKIIKIKNKSSAEIFGGHLKIIN